MLFALASALLAACVWVDDAEQQARFDRDGDGVPYPDDCDDADPAVGAGGAWYYDGDGDGYGGDASLPACEAPGGYLADASDCDDDDPLSHPGAPELCDGADNDCDGEADELDLGQDWAPDADGDGFGDAGIGLQTGCDRPESIADNADDCDDDNPLVHPGAEEADYDGVDADCNGTIDTMSAADVALWTVEGSTEDAHLGSGGLLTGSDLDGDGAAEILVAAPDEGTAQDGGGAVALFNPVTGPASLSILEADLLVSGNVAGMGAGSAIAVLDDALGTGRTLLAVGAGRFGGGDGVIYVANLDNQAGAKHLDRLSAGVVQAPDGAGLGAALAAADVDGDGRTDLWAGAPALGDDEGSAYLLLGNGGYPDHTLQVTTAALWVTGAAGDGLGTSLAAGDMDGDGYADLVVCAPGRGDTTTGAGTCWWFAGSANPDGTGLVPEDLAIGAVVGPSEDARLGRDAQSVALVEHEGTPWLALGSAQAGMVGLFSDLSGEVDLRDAPVLFEGPEGLGTAVTGPGDLGGNEAEDLLLGAPAPGSTGQVYLLTGWASGTLPGIELASWEGGPAGDDTGSRLGPACDLDEDGRSEFPIAAPLADGSHAGAGLVSLLPGYP